MDVQYWSQELIRKYWRATKGKVILNARENGIKNIKCKYPILIPKGTFEYAKEIGAVKKILNSATKREVWKNGKTVENGAEFAYETQLIDTTPTYVAEFENANVCGGVDFVVKDGYILNDVICHKPGGRTSVSEKWTVIEENQGLYIPYYNARKEIPCAISLLMQWVTNYSHFTLDSLARLAWIDCFEEYRDYPILVDENALIDSRSLDLLNYVNVYNHPVIKVKLGHSVRVKKLIYPSQTTYRCYASQKADWHMDAVNEDAVTFLRKRLLPHIGTPLYAERIFVERGNNKRLVNEDKVKVFFQKHGFQIVNPNKMSLLEEINCFAHAKFIIGCSGTAFTNSIYCKQDCTCIIIVDEEYVPDFIASYAKAVNYPIVYAVADLVERNGWNLNTRKFCLSQQACENVIKYINH